ncbi:MAG: zinc-binding dehydrogenase, partial [Candidatus Geothermarchaeales archaeon]
GNTAPCFRCHPCREGRYNLCEDRTWLWGAYAEYIKVPSAIVRYNTQVLPKHLAYEEAAMAEPLGCVIHGARRAGVKMGDTVVLIGSGPIGIMHMQVAKIRGAERVVMIDPVDERLEVAEKMGADETINPRREKPVERVKQLTGGRGADVVIEAVGLPETWEQALEMVKKGGTVLEFGGCPPGTRVGLEADLLHYGEVALLGAFHAKPHDFEVALSLIASGAVRVKPLITREMGLGEVEEALRILSTSKKDLKIAIIP